MIFTVTLNPSLDYIVSVDHFQAGGINRTRDEIILPGGKGINVAIVLKRLGFGARALGFTAGFTGREIQKLLEETGVETDFIHVSGNSRINVKMRSDQETEINGRGPQITEADLDQLFAQLDQLKQEDVLVLSGSTPSGVQRTIYMDIMKRLENRGVMITVDAEGELLGKVLSCHPFLVKPNHHELSELFQTAIETREEALICAKKLQEAGARNVLVSMAEKGAVLQSETGETYLAEAPRGRVKNSVGAGDSMVAGFLAGYLRNHSYEEAFRLAVCTGSAAAFSDGLAEEKDVLTLLEQSRNCFYGTV